MVSAFASAIALGSSNCDAKRGMAGYIIGLLSVAIINGTTAAIPNEVCVYLYVPDRSTKAAIADDAKIWRFLDVSGARREQVRRSA